MKKLILFILMSIYLFGYGLSDDSNEKVSILDNNNSLESREKLTFYLKLTDDVDSQVDVNITVTTEEGDTATAGNDYEEHDTDHVIELHIPKNTTSLEFNLTTYEDELCEGNETFTVHIKEASSTVDIDTDNDTKTGTIEDDDKAKGTKGLNGEYNDHDNYYLDEDDGTYKRLFCSPLNLWDNDGKITIETPDAIVSQIFHTPDGDKSYYRLYAKNIEVTNDGDPGEVCDQGTAKCETENIERLGDKMDVNTSWFDTDGNTDLPDCDNGVVKLYNVDGDGNQIIYKGGEIGDCSIEFHNRNYDIPFLFDGTFKVYGDSNLTMDYGFYYFDEIKMDTDVVLTINDDRSNKWDNGTPDYNITRLYFKDSDHDYIWAADSIINYEDCDGDGDRDDDDMVCQRPSEFMYWVDPNSDRDIIIQNGAQLATYVYNGDKVTFDKDNDGVKNFVGAVTAQNIDLDPDSHPHIYWLKPNSDDRLFLGDSEKCIYTPKVYLNSEDRNFKEGMGDNADLNFRATYYNNGTRQAMCEKDWNVTFDYNVSQRYTNDDNKEHNATQDVDYEMENYTGTIKFTKQCDDCDNSDCWLPLIKPLEDFNITNDNESEIYEYFDLNLTNLENGEFENKSTEKQSYLMTIYDVILATGEFNDKDNYSIKSGANEGKYKMLFCTPVNNYYVDDNDDREYSMIEFHSDDDGNITQAINDHGDEITYYRLYSNNVKNDSDDEEPVLSCGKNGTEPCLQQNVRSGDKMDVNKSWFNVDEIGDYVEKDVPECDGDDADNRDEVILYNVDENGNQIVYNEMDDDFKNCVAKFKVRDSNWSKPFIFKKFLTTDNTALIFDFGRIYFYKYDVHGDDQEMYINDDRIDDTKIGGVEIDWNTTKPEYNITRMYVDTTIGSTPNIFYTEGHYNYLDCNDDGELDENDLVCQRPSEFLVWTSGKYDGSNTDCPSDDHDDMCTNVIKDSSMTAAYFYVDSPLLGTANKFVNKNVNIDDNGDFVYFVGGINAYLVKFNDNGRTRHIRWVQPNPEMKLFLGDSEKCLYRARLSLKNEDEKRKPETEEESDPIYFDIHYLTDFSRKAFCSQDANLSFDYKIIQRYSDDANKDGNATEDEDYNATKYSRTITIRRNCSDCDNNVSCYPDGNFTLSDINIKFDKKDEPDELFDLNISNADNIDLEIPYNDIMKYVMTVVDVPVPLTLDGMYDAYDTNRADSSGDRDNNNNGKVGDEVNEDRNITTKIVGKEFTLTFGSFDKDEITLKLETDDDENNIEIRYGILKCQEENSTIANCERIYVSDNDTFDDLEENRSFTINQIVKYGAGFVEVCSKDKDDGNLSLYTYDDCDGETSCKDSNGNNQKCLRDVMSTDRFTIRPKEFKVTNIPDKVVAGEDFNFTIQALDENGDVVDDYNETVKIREKNVSLDYNETKSACLTGDLNLSKNSTFGDGEVTVVLHYNEVGKVKFSFKEFDDNSTFASIDKGEEDYENSIYIDKPDDFEITFIPHHFNVETKFENHNPDNTYISSDENMSAILEFNITAKNKDDKVTENYSDGCYSKDTTIKVSHSVPTEIETKFYIKGDVNSTFNKDENISFSETDDKFKDGSMYISLLTNFEKDYAKPVNPFDFNLDVLNIKDEDDVESNSSIDKNVSYIYARVDYPKSFTTYLDTVEQYFTYEYYDNNEWKDLTSHTIDEGNVSKEFKVIVDVTIDNNITNYQQKTTEEYTGKRPYKEILHFFINSWLWYKYNADKYDNPSESNKDCSTHPCMGVLFQKPANIGWGGTGVKDTVGKNTIDTVIKHHDTEKKDRSYQKMNW